ncbi:hypothetical protein IEQ34_014738 [Dendrobium chrysotoxum]|uniref:CAF17 C-terminal domain-containing protein n=1 Tax=Dendrobium chrysotoxum TaxID=161865 RepID=A0AAV7GL25_DENCH|nr:hypothetical protein IEQ34_014738 [Dendrobium chrysotoxum]
MEMPLFRFSHLRRLLLPRTPILRFNQTRLVSQQESRLDDAGPLACHLASRSVIRFRGPDTIKFLQGLLTNDVRPLVDIGRGGDSNTSFSSSSGSYLTAPNSPFQSPSPRYAALLTPQGRFLYDLFLYRPPLPEQKLNQSGTGPGPREQEDAFTLHADVDASILDEILVCFRKYKLRSKVDIENVSEEFSCWQRFGGKLSENEPIQEPEAAAVGWGGNVDQSSMSSVHASGEGWQWHRDPRQECLGFRGIFPSNIIPPLVEADKEADEQHFLLWRIERGVPEGSTEIPKCEAIPLEYNLEGLNAISFDKGCYVGQELVARTHHRGVIRKRLLPLIFTDDSGKELAQEVSPGSEVVDKHSKKKVGTVNTALGSRGMGLLKLEAALKQPSTLAIKDKTDVRVKAFRPEWWPSEWTQLQELQSVAD